MSVERETVTRKVRMVPLVDEDQETIREASQLIAALRTLTSANRYTSLMERLSGLQDRVSRGTEVELTFEVAPYWTAPYPFPPKHEDVT